MNNQKGKGSGVGILYLIGLLFLPIHIGVFLYIGNNNWYLLEVALIGAIIGVFTVWNEEIINNENKMIQSAFIGLIGSVFLVVVVFGPFILIGNWIIENIIHIQLPMDKSPAWLIFLYFFVGYELFYWLAIFLFPTNKKMSRKKKEGNGI